LINIYPRFKTKIGGRRNGALVSTETGKTPLTEIMGVEDRGTFLLNLAVEIIMRMMLEKTLAKDEYHWV